MAMGALNRMPSGPEEQRLEKPAPETGASDKPKIFVVEDDADISRLLRHNLEVAGYRVRTYSSTHSVVADALKDRPDILLPGGDGLELCRQVRQSGKGLSGIPIVFLTAKTGEADRIRGLEIGADDYITKPFSPRELVARLKAVLRRCEAPLAP